MASAAGREPRASWPGWWAAGGSGCFAPTVGMAPASSTSIAPISCANSACEPTWVGAGEMWCGRAEKRGLRRGRLRCARRRGHVRACRRISASSVLRSLTKSSSMAADLPSTGAYMSSSKFATPMSTAAKGGAVI
eukprot:scaffold10423_cov71-Phaeocystis_antarctica.AAC.1